MSTRSTIDTLISLLHEEGQAVFASADDAKYFRKAFQKEKKTNPLLQSPPPSVVIKETITKADPIPESKPKLKIEAEPVPLTKPIVNFSSIRNVLSVVTPELAILDQIPSDEIAKKLSERWRTKNQTAPISILVYQEPSEQRELLEEIAKAIDIYFGPAKIVQAETIEKEKQWEAFLSVENLKMVIACDYTLWQLSHLMQHYKEIPQQGTRTLGSIPLFLLPDLSLYLKDALLKRSLWKALCQKCS